MSRAALMMKLSGTTNQRQKSINCQLNEFFLKKTKVNNYKNSCGHKNNDI